VVSTTTTTSGTEHNESYQHQPLHVVCEKNINTRPNNKKRRGGRQGSFQNDDDAFSFLIPLPQAVIQTRRGGLPSLSLFFYTS